MADQYMEIPVSEFEALHQQIRQLREHDKQAVDLTVDQAAENGQLRLALERALHYIQEAERAIRDAMNVRQS